MAEYYKQIEGGFCDYHDFYRKVAERLPNDAQIVEIGVAYGESSIYLAECLRELKKRFYFRLIDNMEYDGDRQQEVITSHIVNSGFANNFLLFRSDSLEASRGLNDGSMDFVFIDGNHTEPFVTADVRLWRHKVKPGGFMAGHDYLLAPGVREGVHKVFPPDRIHEIKTTRGYGVWVVEDPAAPDI